MTAKAGGYSDYHQHMLAFIEQQHELIEQQFNPKSLDAAADSQPQPRYNLRRREAIPKEVIRQALDKLNVEIQQQNSQLFNQRSMHALAERLAIAWQQRPVQIPDTILVPEKIEVDSIRSISSYPEKWPDNYNSVKGIEIEGESKGEYAIVRDEVEKMQGELLLIKAKHSYYKSMHKQLKELLARQIEDSLLTPDIAKDLDGINTKICRITDALEKGTIHGP